jgi:hypothetical protein
LGFGKLMIYSMGPLPLRRRQPMRLAGRSWP